MLAPPQRARRHAYPARFSCKYDPRLSVQNIHIRAKTRITNLVTTMDHHHDFSVEDISGKGKGVIAHRRFERGETVLAESPLFTQNLVRGNSTVLRALATCTQEQRKEFYRLHNCHTERYPAALGIFETNVLPCGGNDAHGHVAHQGGIFLLGSRFNSSCIPNVNNHWDAGRRQLVFRALRDIEPGEELCLGYGRLLAKRDERREELHMKFGFECRCEACCLEGQALAESDVRRECLGMVYSAHLQGGYDDPMEGVSEAVLALRLLREERLPVYESSFYYTGFHCCAAVSDYSSAQAWARKAFDASRAAFGAEHASYWKTFISDPRNYAEAGSLGKRTLAGPDSPLWSALGLS